MEYPRPNSARHAVMLLLTASLLFAGGIFAARRQNLVAIPLMVAAAVIGIWGARTPRGDL